jgi:Pyruvate/2-oxoacid:ferredoxin oxidoreductase delta subunit
MIKQGKNTIYCDICNAEIPQTKDLIETKHLSGGIQINYFRCKSCGIKTLVYVTDKATREKQQELNKWSEQHKKALDVNMDGLSKEEFNKLSLLLNETEFNMKKLKEEIKSSMVKLKEKYEGEL